MYSSQESRLQQVPDIYSSALLTEISRPINYIPFNSTTGIQVGNKDNNI